MHNAVALIPPVETKFDRRHLELLEAGRDIVVEQGLGGLTMDALACAVKISRPTCYHHFDNSDDAFEKIALHSLSYVNRLISGASAVQGTTKYRILTHLAANEMMGRFHPYDFNVIEYLSFPWVQEKLQPSLLATYQERVESYVYLLASLIEEALKKGDLKRLTADLTAPQFASNLMSTAIGLTTSIAKQRISHRAAKPIDEWAEHRRYLVTVLNGFDWGETISLREIPEIYRGMIREAYPDYVSRMPQG